MDMLKIHKEEYVRMAIGKALEKNKLDINYISGILNNWLREAYPKTYEEMELSDSEGGKTSLSGKPLLRFNNFEGRHYDYDDLEKKLLGWK
jgi:DnaD and phage-associated domain